MKIRNKCSNNLIQLTMLVQQICKNTIRVCEFNIKGMECVKEGNVIFNDALNTFYLWLYGVRHMVKDHSDSERGNPLPQHGLLFSIKSKGSFICTIPQTGKHIPRPLLPVVEHWLEQEIAQWVHSMKDQSDDPSHHEQTLLPQSYISLPKGMECVNSTLN